MQRNNYSFPSIILGDIEHDAVTVLFVVLPLGPEDGNRESEFFFLISEPGKHLQSKRAFVTIPGDLRASNP